MSLRIQEHISLKEFTTMKIGGQARFFAVVTHTEELPEAIVFAKEKGIPVLILGGGSNMLVGSGEIDALVMKVEIKGMEWTEAPQFSIFNFPACVKALAGRQFSKSKDVLVIAGAGESWDGLVAQAVERGLWGVENLSGIPGTVGGAPIQNIGAYGTEVKEVIEWVEVFDTKTGKLTKLAKEACGFSYRDSVFKHPEGKPLVVTRVAFRLNKNGTPHLEYKDLKSRISNSKFLISNLTGEQKDEKKIVPHDIRIAVLEIRSRKFPDLNEFGTAGSFFKNPIIPEAQFNELKKQFPNLPGFPLTRFDLKSEKRSNLVKVPLAWILDNLCGLKGFEKGNVKLFEKQPIVLVQNGSASSEEIEAFAKEIISQVKIKTGIEVEWEVAFIGPDKSHPARDAGSTSV